MVLNCTAFLDLFLDRYEFQIMSEFRDYGFQSIAYEPRPLEVFPNMFIEATQCFFSFLKWTFLFWSPWFLSKGNSSSPFSSDIWTFSS